MNVAHLLSTGAGHVERSNDVKRQLVQSTGMKSWYVIHATDGCIPSDMATGDEDELEEERRLLYVALTRARDELMLTYPQRYYKRQKPRDDVHMLAVVSRFLDTGDVRLSRLIAVDDCGRILNPMLVRGQQHGGLAQGVAQALFEEVRLDEAGNPITSTLMTYLMPSAAELPSFECDNTETPTPVNPLGAKGIGESGSIGSTPAVQNAVVDALSHIGVRHVDMPCSPERVWAALAAVTGDQSQLATMVAEYIVRRDALISALSTVEGVRPFTPRTIAQE